MSNPITEAREDVAAALGAIDGVRVFDFIPERMAAPAAVVTPGSPYVVPGRVLGELNVALNIRLYADRGTNEVVTKALDELIVNVCDALTDYGNVIVARPGIDSESYDQTYLVTDITINTTYRRNN